MKKKNNSEQDVKYNRFLNCYWTNYNTFSAQCLIHEFLSMIGASKSLDEFQCAIDILIKNFNQHSIPRKITPHFINLLLAAEDNAPMVAEIIIMQFDIASKDNMRFNLKIFSCAWYGFFAIVLSWMMKTAVPTKSLVTVLKQAMTLIFLTWIPSKLLLIADKKHEEITELRKKLSPLETLLYNNKKMHVELNYTNSDHLTCKNIIKSYIPSLHCF